MVKRNPNNASFALWLPKDLKQKLKEEADQEYISLTKHIVRILMKHVKNSK